MLKIIIFKFLYRFDVLMSNNFNFFLENIILMHFQMKNIMKSNRYYTPKQPLSIIKNKK